MCSVHLYSPYLCSWKLICIIFSIKREIISCVCFVPKSSRKKKKKKTLILQWSFLLLCNTFHKQGVCPQMCFLIDNIVLSLIDCDIEFDLWYYSICKNHCWKYYKSSCSCFNEFQIPMVRMFIWVKNTVSLTFRVHCES